MTARVGKAKARGKSPRSMAKVAPPASSQRRDPDALLVPNLEGERPEQTIARAIVNPAVQAAYTIYDLEKQNTDANAFAKELAAQVAAVQGNDLKSAEAILISQAYTLNELFNYLARRASGQTNPGHFEMYYRIALRAQSQSRATLETLAAIKNPPVIYAKQANVTNGPQQINNGVAHTGEKTIEPNKLLETTDGQRMDTGTKGTAIGCDQSMAPVGEIDRPQDRIRKVAG